MSDFVLYVSQSNGLTDSQGRKLSEADIPRIRPGEVRTAEISLLDYAFEAGDIVYVCGDTDLKGSTTVKIVGTDVALSEEGTLLVELGTTEDYADYIAALSNPAGLVVLWMQIQITKADGRVHKIVFQLRGGASVDGIAGTVPDPTYVTSDQLAQAIAQVQGASGVSQEDIDASIGAHDLSETAHSALFSGKVSAALVGAASGVCDLNEDGLVPSSRLPSYVDDVLEYSSTAALPETGETGKIYLAIDTLKQYRWSGSTYAEIATGGIALGETSGTAYRGDRGQTAYDHSQATGNPHGTTLADLGAASSTHNHDSSYDAAGSSASVASTLSTHTGTTTSAHGGIVPSSRTVNGKALSADISLACTDVGAIPTSEKGANNGIATLGSDGKIPSGQLPDAPAIAWAQSVSCSDLTSALTTGTAKAYFRVAGAKSGLWARASVLTAPAGAAIQVGIKVNGASILSSPLAIDAGSKTSKTSAAPVAFSSTTLADDDEVTIDIANVGSNTAGAGLVVTIGGIEA